MKKNILIFSLAYYPKHIGGAEVAIKEITDRLPTDEYEFHLICNRYDNALPKTELIGQVRVHRIGLTTKNPSMADLRKLPLHLNKILYQWLAFREAKKLHQQYVFHGVWAMMAHSTGIPAAKFKKKFPQLKYLLTLQEGDPPEVIEKKMRIFGESFIDAFRCADQVQVISNFLGQWAKRRGFKGVPILVPNAVTISHFTQPFEREVLAATRQELGLTVDDVALVTTSRLVHKNGIDDVVRAMAKLPLHTKFIIFGTGPDEELLRQLIQKLELTDRVFLKGHIDHKDMPRYLKACNIFIRPSRSEGMGNSFLEAMAAELPVIATQEGGIADFLFDAERNPNLPTTGFVVDVNNSDQIVRAVHNIIEQPERVTQVVATAKAMVIRQYDWNIIAHDMDTKVFRPLFLEV